MEYKGTFVEKIIYKADELAHSVYSLIREFPKFEMYALSSQLRRAVISVVLNIIEGNAKGSNKHFLKFLNISFGSLAEVRYLLNFAFKEDYITEKEYRNAITLSNEVGKMLWILIERVKKDIRN